jgi:hypothetical protein
MNPSFEMLEQIRRAIKGAVDKIVNEEIEEANKRAYKRMVDAITPISLDICSWYSIEDMGTHLEIKVSKKDAK